MCKLKVVPQSCDLLPPVQLLIYICRDSSADKPAFSGMIEWKLKENPPKLELAPSRESRNDKDKVITFVWDGQGARFGALTCNERLARFIEGHKSYSVRGQWDRSSEPHRRIWRAANKLWGDPRELKGDVVEIK